ncbi:alpha/beta hydrolase, partial [Mycolicibacterium sp.]|uniref:alpha/beta hydrolase n=1 Tax=Mycolicibacterium sp. TaxID=2320850 RepID=UPI0028A5C0EF
MTLTVGDIERWDPDAVREVFAALRIRAQAVRDAAEGLGRLPLTSWSGQAAAGAAAALERLRRDLDAHSGELSSAAEAARRATDGIEDITAQLRQLRVQAAAWRLDIDPLTGVVRPLPGARPEALAVRLTLQGRLYSLVDQANSVDAELAAAFGSQVSPVAAPHPAAGADHDNRRQLARALARARDTGAANLADLQAVQDALNANPGTRLVLFDADGGTQVHAAVAAGDPFTADHVAVTTPGLNTTLRSSIGTMTREAAELRREARRQLIDAGRGEQTVAAVAWLGYDTPQIPAFDGLPGLGGLGANAAGVNDVSQAAHAAAAAADLARFYARIQAGRAAPAHLTAIGHSYGSLTTGLALQRSTHVDDAVFYGSPGVK